MKVKEIAFVGYTVEDVPRARHFYEKVLGLVPGNIWEGEGMAFIEYEMGAHTLSIGKGAPNFTVGKSGAVAALEVEDFEEATKTLRENKIVFVMEPHETSVCFMSLIEDPDGNRIMIHKRK